MCAQESSGSALQWLVWHGVLCRRVLCCGTSAARDDLRGVVAAQLKRVLSCYGQLSGIYAYAVPKMFRWVPESFMLQHAPQRLPGGLLFTSSWHVLLLCLTKVRRSEGFFPL
jgi:hypothetical protein